MGQHGVVQLLTFLMNELKKKNTTVKIVGEEYYFTMRDFKLGRALLLNDKVDPEAVSKTDFSQFSDDEMWDLINWIAMNGKSKDLYGVGATQIDDILECSCGHIPPG